MKILFCIRIHTDPNERLEKPQELVGVNLAFVAGKPLTIIIIVTVCNLLYSVYA